MTNEQTKTTDAKDWEACADRLAEDFEVYTQNIGPSVDLPAVTAYRALKAEQETPDG
jgi:hypothetical protein